MEWYNLIWLAAGLLSGLTSFGGNMLAIPVLSIYVDARDAVVIGAIAGAAIALCVALLYVRYVDWPRTLLILCGILLGIPLGVAFLALAPVRYILLGASASIMLFLVWDFFGKGKVGQMQDVNLGFVPTLALALLGGIMSGATGMGGPPIAAYALLVGWDQKTTLGSASMVFVLCLLAQVPSMWLGGLITPVATRDGLIGAGLAALGVLLSVPLARRINATLFRHMLLGLIAVSAIVLLIRGINAQ